MVGGPVGNNEGPEVGPIEGLPLGAVVGNNDGIEVGVTEGLVLGSVVGLLEGILEGEMEGSVVVGDTVGFGLGRREGTLQCVHL